MLSLRNVEGWFVVAFVVFIFLAVALIKPVLAGIKEQGKWSTNNQAYAYVKGWALEPPRLYFYKGYNEGKVGANAGSAAYTEFKGFGGPGPGYHKIYTLSPNQGTYRTFENIKVCWIETFTTADYGGDAGKVKVLIYEGPIGP